MQYFHIPSERMVEVEHQYSGTWYYVAPDGTTLLKDLPDHFRELNTYVQVYPGSSSPQLPSASSSPSGNSQPRPIDEAGLKFNINQAKSKSAMAEGLIGVGKVQALAILNNRPEGGYKGWEDLIEINRDLPINWENISQDNPHVVF
jgi:hypothetical protein